ncbi:MAG: SDR family NAD(P)-dependent oxidoreductase [Muribaculaceae bacterium]
MSINKMPLCGATALVTGASSGIGLEFAHQLAMQGINLLIVSNQEHELNQACAVLINKYDINVNSLFIDLTKPNATSIILDFCTIHNIEVDILINNAGIFAFKEVLSLPPAQLNIFIDLHIRVVTQLCRVFGEKMKSRGYGYILNMSSMSCWMPMPGIAMYSATKAYIRVLSRAMHIELKESGVSVTVACPGGIATNLFGLPNKLQSLGVKLGVLATPQAFVHGALKATFSQRKQYINGFVNRIAIFFVAILPTRVRLIVKHRLLDNGKK